MKSIHKSRNRFIILSLVVPVILLLIFVVYPSVDLVAMSFTSWDGVSPERPFNGIRNYIEMFTKSPDLWLSLRNNFIYLAVHMVMIPIELGIAVMLNSGFKGAKLVKTIAFLPFIINGVGMSYAFSYFFSPVNGAFNQILTGLGLSGWICKWLSDPAIVNFVLAAVSAWRFSGYHIVLFSTGLTSIPTEMMEAARIDGANAWHQLWRIQLPNIWLVFSFVMFDCIRGTLQCFDIPFIMTNGGPGYASSTFTLYTIDTAFKYNRIQIRQLEQNRLDTERKLNMQITSYQNNMAASSEQVVSNRENVMQAQKAVQIAGKRYEVGKGTVLELNTSQVQLTEAELTYNQSIYDYLVAKADLDQVLGKDYIAENEE